MDDINCNNSLNKPDMMTYGLLSFKLFLKNDSDRADVEVYFSEPISQETDWYKYDLKEGWTIMDGAIFSADRRSVTFTIVDGGFGDEDGVKNGIIIDPSGVGTKSHSQSSAANSPNSSSSCYIDTLVFPKSINKITAFNGLRMLIGLFIIGLASLSPSDKK